MSGDLLRVSRFESLMPASSPLPPYDFDSRLFANRDNLRRSQFPNSPGAPGGMHYRPAPEDRFSSGNTGGVGGGPDPAELAMGGVDISYFARPISPMLPAMMSRGRIFAPRGGGGGGCGGGGGGGGSPYKGSSWLGGPGPQGPAGSDPARPASGGGGGGLGAGEVPWIVSDRRER